MVRERATSGEGADGAWRVWQLRNRKKMKIVCSHYLPVDSDSLKASTPPHLETLPNATVETN